MKVSASIMGHPDREAYVRELESALDRPVPVHLDPDGPPSGNGDRVWKVARAAWSMFDPAADYHVLIQDDALVCADYLAGIEKALEHIEPGAVLSPYLGTGRTIPARWGVLERLADSVGASFIRGERVMWGVSLAVPVADLPEMIDWADKRGGVPDDMRVAGWAKRANREAWYSWPSLVDHRTIPSLTKHRAMDRVARRHHHGSALELRWDGPVISDPMLLRRRGPRSGPSSSRKVASLNTALWTGRAGNRA